MSPLKLLRALLALCIVPFLTLVVSLVSYADVHWWRKSSTKALQFPRLWGKVTCWFAGIDVQVEGRENLQPEETYIFVGNHTSQTDIMTFQGYMPHDFRWIAKKELFAIPFFGAAMKAVKFIPIDRSRGRQAVKSLNDAAQRIAEGSSVLIFPEGTRSPDGRLQPFKTGAIMLAIKAGVPVVPVGFNGNYQVLPKGSVLSRGGNVVLRIGQPMPTKNFQARDKQELALKLREQVASLLDQCHKPLSPP